MGKKAEDKPKATDEAPAAEEEGAAGAAAKPDNTVRFKFDDSKVEFEINPDDLTLEEQVMVEEFFNMPWRVIEVEGWLWGSKKAIAFFSYLARRRKEPGFTYDQALEFEAKVSSRARDEDGAERPTEGSKADGSPS